MYLNQAKTIDFDSLACEPINATVGLLPIGNRLKINARGFWHAYHILICIFTIALLADCLSTVYFMSHLGVSAEIHPVVRLASVIFGPVAGPVVGSLWKWAVCLYLTIYCRKFAYSIFVTTSVVYIFAAWYNIWGIYLLH